MKFNSITIIITLFLHMADSDNDYTECNSEQCTIQDDVSLSRVLSRRKRFLIFPDGSSFQLVLCVQSSALIPIGDIFLYGNTAALAWTLPSDPALLHMLKGEKGEKRSDMQEIHYLDEEGNLVAKVPYKRPTIIRPTIAKRSVNDTMTYKQKLQLKLDKEMKHRKHVNRDYWKSGHGNKKALEFHRSSRVGFYEKLEKLFTALGGDGRQCVLHKLCEASRLPSRQGTFLQEILAIVFTLPKSKEFEKEDHKIYERAHTNNEDDCDVLYPGCV